jgi:hypothetical protein
LETLQVHQMYTATMMELFQRIAQAQNLDELRDLHTEMVSLEKYVFQSCEKITRRYGHQHTWSMQYGIWAATLQQKPLFLEPVSCV